jgi:aerobic carbon-monoxide dehydrogenase medium subunit
MHNFNYHRAKDVAEAAGLLGNTEDPKLLAGGMTLLPTLKNRLAAPSDLIDLAKIPDLKGITVSPSEVIVKAMTPHAFVAASEEIQKTLPALAQLAGQIGDPAVRHRGTIGGSVANSDPAADYPAAVLGLDATVETNQRKIAADDFFLGLFETALEPGEIITAVRFRVPTRAHYLKFRHPASGYAVVGTMVAQYGSNVRVAVTGAGHCVFRHKAAEDALTKNFAPEAVANLDVPADDLLGDIHCSAEYRAHLVKVYVRRAVEALTR